jgi:hypothetical protein
MAKLFDDICNLLWPIFWRATGYCNRETTVTPPSLDNRHRNKNGAIARKHGNTLISTLRFKYGPNFATGESPNIKLIDVLRRLDEPSLGQLIANKRYS